MGPLEIYRARLAKGVLKADPAQALGVEKLELLANRLVRYAPPVKTDWLAYFTRKRGAVPRGLYIFGGVGSGKTMLMDLFFESIPFAAKRRLHFHQFMAEVHNRIAAARKEVPGDPIPHVAREIANEAKLLCLDEFEVTDIADAMILGRLFEGLFGHGAVIVATSNTPPAELYREGLNRELFLPFIALIEEHMELFALEAAKDYRRDMLAGAELYFAPLDRQAEAGIAELWQRLTRDAPHPPAPCELEIMGRRLRVPLATGHAARFSFADLCEAPLASRDYLRIAQEFGTVFVEAIPMLDRKRRDPARRFVHLIDALYDRRICLVATAAAEPDKLWRGPPDDAVAFARTASRLNEMRSADYVARIAARSGGGAMVSRGGGEGVPGDRGGGRQN